MEKKEYKLDFYQALKLMIDSGAAVKGNDFRDGIFMQLNKHGQIVSVDACRLYDESLMVNLKVLSKQKFREVTVLTVKELMG